MSDCTRTGKINDNAVYVRKLLETWLCAQVAGNGLISMKGSLYKASTIQCLLAKAVQRRWTGYRYSWNDELDTSNWFLLEKSGQFSYPGYMLW